jgi:hypothetical protein
MQCNLLPYRAMLALLPALLLTQTATADDNIAAMRAELEALKAQYETRIHALEQRLNAAEQQLAQAQPADQPASIAAAPAGYAASGNEYNPAIGVVLNGAIRAYENDPQEHYIPGFPAAGESGLADEGLSIGESEFILTANVDDWFYARVTAAMEQEDGEFNASLEEAFVDTLGLPANATLRFGRFYSAVGYLNDKHSHTWAFADQALPYSAFLGVQYGDDGIGLRWLAPTDLYLELGAEVFRGSSYPAAGDAHNGFGTQTLFARAGGDIGFSHSWLAGLSWLGADARDRDYGDEDDPLRFDGDSDIYIAEFVWKWAPNGNIRERNFTFQSEYLWRNESGSYQIPGMGDSGPADNDARGWYAQAIYQWKPRWRAGVRMDGLSLDDPGKQFADTPLDTLGSDPLRYSFMLDYSNSAFSRIRLQFNRDESGPEDDNQLILQYIMSIGAHGAHEF